MQLDFYGGQAGQNLPPHHILAFQRVLASPTGGPGGRQPQIGAMRHAQPDQTHPEDAPQDHCTVPQAGIWPLRKIERSEGAGENSATSRLLNSGSAMRRNSSSISLAAMMMRPS